MVEFGNFYYFIGPAVAICLYIFLLLLLKKKAQKTQYLVLLGVLFFNLILHFLKLAFEPYRSGLPGTIRKVTFENICAVSTLLMPFVFLYRKSRVLNTYMFFIGVIGGLAALIYPTEALGNLLLSFDSIRFYICHIILALVPLLSVSLGLFSPHIKMAWAVPLIFICVETLIMVNEIVLIQLGWVQSDLAAFLDRDTRNNSFVFGPTSDFQTVGDILTFFTPKIFTKDAFNINGGVDFYWPVIWLVIPAFIYFPIIYCIICLPNELLKILKYRKRDKTCTYLL
jgi:hypothetical protein